MKNLSNNKRKSIKNFIRGSAINIPMPGSIIVFYKGIVRHKVPELKFIEGNSQKYYCSFLKPYDLNTLEKLQGISLEEARAAGSEYENLIFVNRTIV